MNDTACSRVAAERTCGRQKSAGATNGCFAFRNVCNAARAVVLVSRTRFWHTRLPFALCHATRPRTLRALRSPLLPGDRLSTPLPNISRVDWPQPSNSSVFLSCLLNFCALIVFEEFRATLQPSPPPSRPPTAQPSERSSSLGAYNVTRLKSPLTKNKEIRTNL